MDVRGTSRRFILMCTFLLTTVLVEALKYEGGRHKEIEGLLKERTLLLRLSEICGCICPSDAQGPAGPV